MCVCVFVCVCVCVRGGGAVHGQETGGRLSYKMTQADKVLLWQDSTAAMINPGQEREVGETERQVSRFEHKTETSTQASLFSPNKIIETEEVCACVFMFVFGGQAEGGRNSFMDVRRV